MSLSAGALFDVVLRSCVRMRYDYDDVEDERRGGLLWCGQTYGGLPSLYGVHATQESIAGLVILQQ
jgi:hypothetical protein